MDHRRWLALATIILFALVSMSCITPCCAPSLRRSIPSAVPTVPVSRDAARRFEEKLKDLEAETFKVEFTEDEITSYIALHSGDNLPLQAPQVRILPGKFVLEGDITSPVKGRVVLSGTVSARDGRPQFEILGASIGGLSLPGSLLASLSDSLLEALHTSSSPADIHQIELAQGRVTVVGRSRPR